MLAPVEGDHLTGDRRRIDQKARRGADLLGARGTAERHRPAELVEARPAHPPPARPARRPAPDRPDPPRAQPPGGPAARSPPRPPWPRAPSGRSAPRRSSHARRDRGRARARSALPRRSRALNSVSCSSLRCPDWDVRGIRPAGRVHRSSRQVHEGRMHARKSYDRPRIGQAAGACSRPRPGCV
jgi:hypothetical protein